MTPTKIIRKKILECLKMAEGYGKTESMIRELVEMLTSEDPGLQELRNAMERLHEDGCIRSEKDDDEVVLWFITPRGTAKLNTL